MKKRIRIIVSLCLICVIIVSCLCSCGSPQTESADTNTNKESGKENTENKNVFGDWLIEEYKDEFGDSKGSTFCYTMCEGSFENTATSGSDLIAGVYYDASQKAFLFRLLEYKDKKATYLSDDIISMKCKVGEYVFEDTLIGNAPNGDLFLLEKSTGYNKLYTYLNDGSEIRTIIYIGNSKYTFTINGNGFKDALEEQEKRKELAGISGTYKNALEVMGDAFVIKQANATSGTITHVTDDSSATLDYKFDPTTHILTVVPDSSWTYACLYDTFLVYNNVLAIKDGNVEGKIPEDEPQFDAIIKFTSSKPDSKYEMIYEFNKDGSYTTYGTDYKGEALETRRGTYIVKDSFLFEKESSNHVYADYIYEGRLFRHVEGVYVIDN